MMGTNSQLFYKQKKWLSKSTHIAPLVIFRLIFGAIMFFSSIRFMLNGWVEELYVNPTYYFTYYGFDWVHPIGKIGMYAVFTAMAIAFLFSAVGFLYRWSSVIAFFLFTYVELLDKTNYLNHYYFVSIVCLLLIFVPAHRYFSIDVWRKPSLKRTHVPYWMIFVLQLQLALVYFFAGLAKLNYDWIMDALPLKIWLPTKSNLPLIGSWLTETWVAYAFSWFGALYDLSIVFLLFNPRSRWFAYLMVIVFHVMTKILFPIGMFPYIMIGATLIFFSPEFHQKIIFQLSKILRLPRQIDTKMLLGLAPKWKKILTVLIPIYFLLQVLIPLRFLAYPGKLFWTEQGYRFSWRVMLMEKAGYAIFHIEDPKTGHKWEVNNYDFLSPFQEKMMSTQPDFILQFAHYLADYCQNKGIQKPIIKVESYASLNGSPSQLYLDSTVNLVNIKRGFSHKKWILPFNPLQN